MSRKGVLRSLYWYCDSLKRFYANEKPKGVHLSVAQRVRWVSRGFHSYSAGIYGLNEATWKDYISDFGRYQLIRLNGRSPAVLNDKLLFARTFSQYVAVPKLVATISRGKAVSLLSDVGIGKVLSLAEILKVCPSGVAIKPNPGGGGFGVNIVTQHSGISRLNGEVVPESSIEDLLSRMDAMLIVERVVQHELSESFFPGTTNSIRVTTMIDPDSSGAFVAGAAWRIGVQRSIPVDNWMRGGICAAIDSQTGELSEAALFAKDGPTYLSWVARHPETGVKIAGQAVPDWSKLVENITETAELFPMYPVLGWDVVVTTNGFAVLEINSAPGVNILQMHTPLLKQEKVRRFVQHSRILLSPVGRSL